MKETFLNAIAQTERLAPAPRTIGRALQLLRNPDTGLDAIARLICCDSAVAVDVLRCANSAYFNRGTQVADVGEAVQVIGFRETMRLVSLVAMRQATHRNLGCYGITAEDFWAETLFNGIFLDQLARHAVVLDTGEAYTAGLLRFVGRLAIDQVLQELGGNLFWTGATPLAEWERENVGLTQAEVGAHLLQRWEFPERMRLAIAAQDDVLLAGPAAREPIAECMHFAAQILPAGSGLAIIRTLAAARVAVPTRHPFALAHHVTEQEVVLLLQETHRTYLAITENLCG